MNEFHSVSNASYWYVCRLQKKQSHGLLKEMNMKFAGYSISVSFSPLSSNFIRNSCGFPVSISRRSRRNLCSSRLFSVKQHSYDKPGAVAKHYLPPWFRWVSYDKVFLWFREDKIFSFCSNSYHAICPVLWTVLKSNTVQL
jgi:hypothetical protein